MMIFVEIHVSKPFVYKGEHGSVQPNKAMNKQSLKRDHTASTQTHCSDQRLIIYILVLILPSAVCFSREAIINTAMYPCQCKLTIHHIMGPVLSKYKLSSAVKDMPRKNLLICHCGE